MLKRSLYGLKKKKKSNSETKPTITSRKLFGLFYTHEPLVDTSIGGPGDKVTNSAFLSRLLSEPIGK